MTDSQPTPKDEGTTEHQGAVESHSAAETGTAAGEPGTAGAVGAVDSVEAPVLCEPRTLPVWQMERDLRRAKAAQLVWMLQFYDQYVAEARVSYVEDYESAKAREASTEVLANLWEVVEYAEQEAGRAAIMYIAEAVNRSEYVVTTEHRAACRATGQLPQVWAAFTQGRICDLRLRRITTTAQQLSTGEAVAELDDRAPGFAQTHRIGELDSWLKQFLHTAEPEAASQRFACAARDRRVTVTDFDDGMSLLTAVIPTLSARAIQRRLEAITGSPSHPVPHNPLIAEHIFALEQHESFTGMLPHAAAEPEGLLAAEHHTPTVNTAQHAAAQDESEPHDAAQHDGLPHDAAHHAAQVDAVLEESWEERSPEPSPYQRVSIDELPTTRQGGDPRTLDQRAADAFCAWMLNAQTPEGIEIDAQIGIIVSEDTLTGASQSPATTRDGTTVIPAGNIQDLLAHQIGRLEWYQLLHSADDDLLAIKSSGRYPPPRLRTALWFRDTVCQAQGCTTPAERCDADHITPYETGGPTTAENLQLLCRKHHRLKSWGYLVPVDYLYAAGIRAELTPAP